MENNKKIFVVLGAILVIVGVSLLILFNNKDYSEKKIDVPERVKVKKTSDFDKQEQQEIHQKIENLESKDLDNKSDIIDLAKNYRYLGYIGKALKLYQEKFPLSTDFVVLSNKANLQGKFCKIDPNKYQNFCKESLANYNFLIQNYNKKKYDRLSEYYIRIVKILLDMDRKKEAQKIYNLYKSKTGNSVSWLEKKFTS